MSEPGGKDDAGAADGAEPSDTPTETRDAEEGADR